MKAADIKNIKHLYKILSDITNYEFIEKKDILGRGALFLQGIDKKCEISLRLGNWNTNDERNGKQYISFSGTDERNGHSGTGCGYDAVDEIIRAIDIWAAKYGYKPCGKQLQMF